MKKYVKTIFFTCWILTFLVRGETSAMNSMDLKTLKSKVVSILEKNTGDFLEIVNFMSAQKLTWINPQASIWLPRHSIDHDDLTHIFEMTSELDVRTVQYKSGIYSFNFAWVTEHRGFVVTYGLVFRQRPSDLWDESIVPDLDVVEFDEETLFRLELISENWAVSRGFVRRDHYVDASGIECTSEP